jgi:hypothetical protein
VGYSTRVGRSRVREVLPTSTAALRSRRTRDRRPRLEKESAAGSHAGRILTTEHVVGSFVVQVELAVVDGVVRPISWRVQGYESAHDEAVTPLTAGALRRVPFGAIVDRAVEQLLQWQGAREEITRSGGTTLHDPGYAAIERQAVKKLAGPVSASKRGRGRPPTDPETIAHAAEVYMRIKPLSRSAIIDTANEIGVSRSTAYRRLVDAGVLAGGKPKKKGRKS